MSEMSETTKLLEETRAIVYEEEHRHTHDTHDTHDTGEGNVTLSSLHTLLTQINTKLSNMELKNNALDSRLSTIESKINSLDEIRGTLNSMKGHLNKLEEDIMCTKKDFEKLESNMKSLGNLFDSVNEETKSNRNMIICNKNNIEQCKTDQKLVNLELQALREKNSNLQDSVVDLKARSMRDNLVFSGIPERAWEDTEQVLQDFLQRKYRLDYLIDFERVHRMGRYDEFSEYPRKIVAKFSYFKDREYIRMNAAKKLKGTSDQFV
ncbi:uncharacterized protein LOC134263905 [Saccostrea cucullata]|uniref:uncharacterized protein LOC134263905 n=1 Tax=Saccostrea cuccullata TaxID=36930 RepID=UPI002ED138C0